LSREGNNERVWGYLVSGNYFEVLGVNAAQGRTFTADDRSNTMPVALVNRAFVRQQLAGRDPLGVQFAYGFPTIDPNTMRTIVGVVDDVRYASLGTPPEAAFYMVQRQMPFPFLRGAVVVLPKAGRPESLVAPIREELKEFDPRMTADFDTASDVVAATLSRQALGMTLILIFGVTALVLAAVGIYGVIAYAAAQREREIATRIALGATPRDVFRLMMRQGQRPAVAGMVFGLLAAWAAGRLAAASVYEMRATDPLILIGAVSIVGAIACAAVAIPAARARGIDPVRAVRSE